MPCKCGNESKGTDLVKYYKRRDGTMVTYVHKEKRCQECINKGRRKKQSATIKSEFIGY